MTIKEKKKACLEYWSKLCEALSDTHEEVRARPRALELRFRGKINPRTNKIYTEDEIKNELGRGISYYLVPKGTKKDISYYGKPVGSYRISDHWNWYADMSQCEDSSYIQCYCPDISYYAHKRQEKDGPSEPVYGICVAYYGDDHKYHHVFGERFDRKVKKFTFD